MHMRAQAAISCKRSHRSTRSIRPTAPTTTVQSLQHVMEAYCRGAKAYMTLSWQSVMRSMPSGKSSSPFATVLLQTPCMSTTPPAASRAAVDGSAAEHVHTHVGCTAFNSDWKFPAHDAECMLEMSLQDCRMNVCFVTTCCHFTQQATSRRC